MGCCAGCNTNPCPFPQSDLNLAYTGDGWTPGTSTLKYSPTCTWNTGCVAPTRTSGPRGFSMGIFLDAFANTFYVVTLWPFSPICNFGGSTPFIYNSQGIPISPLAQPMFLNSADCKARSVVLLLSGGSHQFFTITW